MFYINLKNESVCDIIYENKNNLDGWKDTRNIKMEKTTGNLVAFRKLSQKADSKTFINFAAS